MGGPLKHQHQGQQYPGPGEQGHPQEADKIPQVHGVAEKAVDPLGVQAILVRGGKVEDRHGAQNQPQQV